MVTREELERLKAHCSANLCIVREGAGISTAWGVGINIREFADLALYGLQCREAGQDWTKDMIRPGGEAWGKPGEPKDDAPLSEVLDDIRRLAAGSDLMQPGFDPRAAPVPVEAPVNGGVATFTRDIFPIKPAQEGQS